MISVGIDVSKGKSTVCFFKPGCEVMVTPFEVAHTKCELNELADKINSYGEEARVVLENTGYYHWSVVKVLVERGIFVSAVNPLKMKRFCSQNIRKVKNDRIDAIHIASYGLTYWHELIIDEQLKMFYHRGLSEWTRERGFLTDTCLAAQDKFKRYLDYFKIQY